MQPQVEVKKEVSILNIQNKIKEKYIMKQENTQEVRGDYTSKYDM
jgi:hypothetical protein